MPHFILFSYITAMIIGFITLGITGSITLRTKDGKLYVYLLFYTAMTFDVFAETVFRYIMVNHPEILDSNIYISILINFFKFYVMFAILVLTHYFSNIKPVRRSIIKYGLISMLCFISNIFYDLIDFKARILNITIADIVYYAVVIYIIISGLIHFLRSRPSERPDLNKIEYLFLKKIVLLYTLSIPLIINDDMKFIPLGFRVSPFVFTILSIIMLQHFYRYHLVVHLSSERDMSANPLFKSFDISEREKETVLLVLKGLSNKEICNELHISLSTVKSHIYSVYKKIGIKSRFELMQIFR